MLDTDKVKLLIIGDGIYRNKLEKRAATLNINDRVVFLGYKDRKNVGRYLHIMDVIYLKY